MTAKASHSKEAGSSIEEIKGKVLAAASELAAFGTEYERVAWLLEDALLLLDESESSEEISIDELLAAEAEAVALHGVV